MSIVNQLMPLVLEYNKMALANNIEYAQHLTIKIDEILKNADIDSQNDEDFQVFCMLVSTLASYEYSFDSDFFSKNVQHGMRVLTTAWSVSNKDWKLQNGHMLSPDLPSSKDINAWVDHLNAQYNSRKSATYLFQNVCKSINSFHKNYIVSLDDLLLSLEEKRDPLDESARARKIKIFSVLCRQNACMVETLKNIFCNFYFNQLHSVMSPNIEKIMLLNLQKMFGVIANCPAYAYVFPLYVFLLFVRYPECIYESVKCLTNTDRHCEQNTANEEKKFYLKMTFPDKLKKLFTARQYTQLFEDIYGAVIGNHEGPHAIYVENYKFIANPFLGKLPYFIPSFRHIYDALVPVFGDVYADDHFDSYIQAFDMIVVGTMGNLEDIRNRRKIVCKFFQQTDMGCAILKIAELLSEQVFIPLYCGLLPSQESINTIFQVYHWLFPNEQLPLDRKTVSAAHVLEYYRRIQLTVGTVCVDLNIVSFQITTHFVEYQSKSNCTDEYSCIINNIFSIMVYNFLKQQPIFSYEIPLEYQLEPDTKLAALLLRCQIHFHQLTLQEIFDFLCSQMIGQQELDEIIQNSKIYDDLMTTVFSEEQTLNIIKREFRDKDIMDLQENMQIHRALTQYFEMVRKSGDSNKRTLLYGLREFYFLKWLLETIDMQSEIQTILTSFNESLISDIRYILSQAYLEVWECILQSLKLKLVWIIQK